MATMKSRFSGELTTVASSSLAHSQFDPAQQPTTFRGDAARALCAALDAPPNIGLCVFGGTTSSSHETSSSTTTTNAVGGRGGQHQQNAALGKAIAQLKSTGAIVRAFSVEHDTDCTIASASAQLGTNATLDTILRVRSGHVFLLPTWWPYCYYKWHAHNVTFGTISLHEQQQQAKQQQQMAQLLQKRSCTSSMRFALGIAGLARTFPHPLVYKSIRGNLLEALSANNNEHHEHAYAVFAALRLDDAKSVHAGGKSGNGAGTGTTMGTTSLAAVQRALAHLGADPRDVLIRQDATIDTPKCYGAGNNATALASLGKATPCTSYKSRCALPTVVGQMWSRRAIFDLLTAHERREGVRFDSILFMRPDLVIPIPFFPLCEYGAQLSSATWYSDWVNWLPRDALDGAFGLASADFETCAIRFAEGDMEGLDPEHFLVELGRRHGVLFSPLDATKSLFSIVRPRVPNPPPMGFVCDALAKIMRSAADQTLQTSSAAVPRGAFYGLAYKGRGAEARFPQGVPTCTRLIFDNPSNAIE